MDVIHHVFEDTPEQFSLELEEEDVEDEGDRDGVSDGDPPSHEYIRKEGLAR